LICFIISFYNLLNSEIKCIKILNEMMKLLIDINMNLKISDFLVIINELYVLIEG